MVKRLLIFGLIAILLGVAAGWAVKMYTFQGVEENFVPYRYDPGPATRSAD